MTDEEDHLLRKQAERKSVEFAKQEALVNLCAKLCEDNDRLQEELGLTEIVRDGYRKDYEDVLAGNAKLRKRVEENERLRKVVDAAIPHLEGYADGLAYFPERASRVRIIVKALRASEKLSEK